MCHRCHCLTGSSWPQPTPSKPPAGCSPRCCLRFVPVLPVHCHAAIKSFRFINKAYISVRLPFISLSFLNYRVESPWFLTQNSDEFCYFIVLFIWQLLHDLSILVLGHLGKVWHCFCNQCCIINSYNNEFDKYSFICTGFPLLSLNIAEKRWNPKTTSGFNLKYCALGTVNVSGTMRLRTFSDAWKKYSTYLTHCVQVKNTHINLTFFFN